MSHNASLIYFYITYLGSQSKSPLHISQMAPAAVVEERGYTALCKNLPVDLAVRPWLSHVFPYEATTQTDRSHHYNPALSFPTMRNSSRTEERRRERKRFLRKLKMLLCIKIVCTYLDCIRLSIDIQYSGLEKKISRALLSIICYTG